MSEPTISISEVREAMLAAVRVVSRFVPPVRRDEFAAGADEVIERTLADLRASSRRAQMRAVRGRERRP